MDSVTTEEDVLSGMTSDIKIKHYANLFTIGGRELTKICILYIYFIYSFILF